MSISCIATKTCFRDGRRYRAGENVRYDGDPDKLPSYLVPRKEYTPPPSSDGTDSLIVEKVDSISDISMQDGSASFASKAATELADEFSVNLEDIKGTGAKGQVTKGDVQRFLDDNSAGEEVI